MLEILQFHANAYFHDVTWANHSNYAWQNPFTCVLNIMSNTPVLQYMNPQNHSNAVFRILLKQVYSYRPVSRIFRGGAYCGVAELSIKTGFPFNGA